MKNKNPKKEVPKNHYSSQAFTYNQAFLFFFYSSSNKNDKYLQAILKMTPCTPFVNSFVFNPLNNNPFNPSFRITY